MSGQQNKTLHTLPFFDSVFDYEALKTQFLEKPPASVSAENDYSGG